MCRNLKETSAVSELGDSSWSDFLLSVMAKSCLPYTLWSGVWAETSVERRMLPPFPSLDQSRPLIVVFQRSEVRFL